MTAAAASRLRLELYGAGDSAASRSARLNLDKLLLDLQLDVELLVIDVLSDFERALQQHVLVTPELIVCSAAQRQMLVGDLSQTESVLATLRALM